MVKADDRGDAAVTVAPFLLKKYLRTAAASAVLDASTSRFKALNGMFSESFEWEGLSLTLNPVRRR